MYLTRSPLTSRCLLFPRLPLPFSQPDGDKGVRRPEEDLLIGSNAVSREP